ncbi:MAG TPA: Trp family transcriptional regulator [Spirochaetota bacterium]|nr:Trp family transcriptional regulator [Spirochaetota bacterium]HPF05227.1 Trp family transcriptional regulator [Spirochaetota bacterium]HPJ40843.1 Trp family transcriptional regulator [Spirochaetota bacterium]HPR37152.1 Trp family transcriptional regulator [Spirochaetota bacterium]HRX46502.1 Trp family transcriptional regulator [Spirochaetota bacterium]
MPDIREISKILADITVPEDMEKFLQEILTDNERKDLSLRWELMKKLFKGVPQRNIASDLGISLCRITRGSKILKSPDSVTGKLLSSMPEIGEGRLKK